MTIRTLDVIALAGLLGYTHAQALSIRDIQIDGPTNRVTVTRFVQHPGSQEPRKATPDNYDPEVDNLDGVSALVASDIFRYTPAPSVNIDRPAPEYLRLPRATVKVLEKMQWGHCGP